MNTNKKQKRAKATKRATANALHNTLGQMRFLALKSAVDCQLTSLRLRILKMRLAESVQSVLVKTLSEELDIVLEEQEPTANELQKLSDDIVKLQANLSNSCEFVSIRG